MRIVITYKSRRKAGGIETYLSDIIPLLVQEGHEVAFWYESHAPLGQERFVLPSDLTSWCVADLGDQKALEVLRGWKPDLIFIHSLMALPLEKEIHKIAPTLFFAHTYSGTCISGAKAFKRPVVRPCSRKFGWKCLLHYYPHRCGGLNPLTMAKLFHDHTKHLQNLSTYTGIITHSTSMQVELINNGLDPKRIHNLAYATQALKPEALKADLATANNSLQVNRESRVGRAAGSSESREHGWRLLFIGRMDLLKGGQVFLDALPLLLSKLNQEVTVTFAGDGPCRDQWEKQAQRIQSQTYKLKIRFVGWVAAGQTSSLFKESDLLVVPSLWPEPFGLVGPEAGIHGVPAAAFAVGGITEWLEDGRNGYLADGNPPTARGLAVAIGKCLRDNETHERLSRGAREVAEQFNIQTHLNALAQIFNAVLAGQSAKSHAC